MQINSTYHIVAGQPEVLQQMRGLLSTYLATTHRRRVERIERAFRVAADASRDRRRINGRPHILHPLAVARIVAGELGLGSTAICAALLHDVLESPDFTAGEIYDIFGGSVGGIVEGLQRISGGIMAAERGVDAVKFRHLLLSMEADARVILVKMADRMHNLRNITDLPASKADRIARETLYVYAPLAYRLGLNSFKEEFEELAFRHLYPEEYTRITTQIEQSESERARIVGEFLGVIRRDLDASGVKSVIKTRVKSAWSIYNKMQAKGIPLSEIYDIYACRIIFESAVGQTDAETGYMIREMIRRQYETSPERDRDWVKEPKSNGYSALHLTAMSPSGRWIEVQIRSQAQDEIAELGYASHWKYKEGSDATALEALEEGMAAIKEILDHPTPDGMDTLDHLRLSLLSSEIAIFEPGGSVVRLPRGSTVADYARTLSEHIARDCIGAKVGRRLLHPTDHLHSGDRVELLTRSGVKASQIFPHKSTDNE